MELLTRGCLVYLKWNRIIPGKSAAGKLGAVTKKNRPQPAGRAREESAEGRARTRRVLSAETQLQGSGFPSWDGRKGRALWEVREDHLAQLSVPRRCVQDSWRK